MFCSLYSTPEVIPPRSRVSRNGPRSNQSRHSRRQPPSLVSAFLRSSTARDNICRYIFTWARIDQPECQSALYLLLRDAKRMLSTWAARNSIIIRSRGMIERCRMLIIAFRRVATGRQVCFTVSTVPRRIDVVDFASYEFRIANLNELREKRFNSHVIDEKKNKCQDDSPSPRSSYLILFRVLCTRIIKAALYNKMTLQYRDL